MDFEPSARRGRALDQQMRVRVADTRDFVLGEVGEQLDVDYADAERLVERVRSERQSFNLFGIYYEIVLALENEDVDRAKLLARELFGQRPAGRTAIGTIESRDPAQVERLRRLILSDLGTATEPGAALLESTRKRLDDAFALLDRGFPEMSAEIRELLSEIIIAAGPEDPKALTFDGASSYMLWGAMLLNGRGQNNVLDTAQALAHESGHNLLFGFCSSGPLVDNPDEELFSSPLRKDPRPMDGVFHATYVIARMHQTVSRLLDAGVLDEREREAAIADLAAHQRNFDAGDRVVRDGARLTPLGAEVIDAARAYMASANELA
jgi:HEXXH motif-containing protein